MQMCILLTRSQCGGMTHGTEFFTSLNAAMTKYIGSLLGFAKYLNLKKRFNISFWLFSTR